MTNEIMLSDLVAIDRLFHKSQFTSRSILDLLGKSLTAWLERLLDNEGVGDKPLILGSVAAHAVLEGRIYVAPGAIIEPHAYIKGPCYIGPNAEVRHAAYIRGSVYVGPEAVVGHTTEVKSSVFLDGAKAGHFAYVGDSILGRDVNLGAGTKLANLKIKANEVSVRHPLTDKIVKTGLKKLGSILGDGAQTGCNAVLSPGTILLPETFVLPAVHYHGTLKKSL